MIESFVSLMQHMERKHPDSSWFGDYGWHDDKGNAHMFCQICGEEYTTEDVIPGKEGIGEDDQLSE